MFIDLMIGRNYPGRKPLPLQLNKIDGINVRFQQAVKNLVIAGKQRKYTPLVLSAGLDLFIIILRTTAVTAELLIRPAITYPVPALQADRHFS